MDRMLIGLILGSLYLVFSFFRVLMSKKLDNDMLP